MKRGKDISVEHPGLYLVHHNLPGKEVGTHHHREHLLFLPLQGEIVVDTGGQRFTAGPGKMVYLPRETDHSFHSSTQQGERLIALLDPKAWIKAGAGQAPVSLVNANQLCKEILFYLLLHPRTRNAAALVDILIRTLQETLEASGRLLDVEHLGAKVSDARLQKALRYFEENLGESFAMSTVAKASGLSTRSMNRLFSVELGLSPKQVLAQFRVTRACELLVAGSSVTETAFAVGYQSMAPFITAFRQLTGQLPSEVARLGRR